MSKTYMVKAENGVWLPATGSDAEALQPLRIGVPFEVQVKEARNYRFHCKGMSLVRFLYNQWEPGQCGELATYMGKPIQKNFDQFRGSLMIMAGFFTPVWGADGALQLVPDSWAFDRMDEQKFRSVYKALLNVGWQKIMQKAGYTSPAHLERCINEYMRYDG